MLAVRGSDAVELYDYKRQVCPARLDIAAEFNDDYPIGGGSEKATISVIPKA